MVLLLNGVRQCSADAKKDDRESSKRHLLDYVLPTPYERRRRTTTPAPSQIRFVRPHFNPASASVARVSERLATQNAAEANSAASRTNRPEKAFTNATPRLARRMRGPAAHSPLKRECRPTCSNNTQHGNRSSAIFEALYRGISNRPLQSVNKKNATDRCRACCDTIALVGAPRSGSPFGSAKPGSDPRPAALTAPRILGAN